MPRKFESCYNFFWYKRTNKNNTKQYKDALKERTRKDEEGGIGE